MKTLTKELWMEVPKRRAIVSIHDEVERAVAESGVKEGMALINAMHITASVFINDNESDCNRITTIGWKGLPRSMRRRRLIAITARVRTTRTRI